jgi:FHS family L-fucose permease-like MFS transporter
MSTTEQPAATSRANARPDRTTHPLVYKNMLVLFAVVICCFTAWGIAADMTALMVAAFKRIFTMSTFQASLVQFSYHRAYSALALPAAFINQRFGYRTGLLTGLA